MGLIAAAALVLAVYGQRRPSSSLGSLSDSRELSRVLIESANDGVYVLSPEGKILFLNPAFAEHTGWSVSDWIGKPFLELVHPEDREAAHERFQALMHGNTFSPQTMRLLTRSGRDWTGEFKSNPLKIHGRVSCVLGIATDITAHLSMERHLRESEKFLAEIFSNILDGISVISPDLTVLRVNNAMAQWYPGQPLVGRKCYEAYRERTSLCENCPARITLTTGKPSSLVLPLTRGGGTIELRTFPFYDAVTNELKGVIEYVHDISGIIQAEQKVKNSLQAQGAAETKFRSLVENTLVGICIIQDDRYQYVNPTLAKMFGYTPEEMLLMPTIQAINAGPGGIPVVENMRKRLAGDPPAPLVRWAGLTKEGQPIDVESTGSIIDYNGRPAILGSARDLSDSRRLEEQLRQAQKMEAVGRLAGGVAHDFNNVLMVITGYSELLLSGLREGTKMRPEVEEILKAAQRGAQLTRQLLAYSRRQMLQSVVLDLNAVINDLIAMLQRVLGENIVLALEPGKGSYWVKADPGNLEQVIMNLAVNARDAMELAGGRLTIRLQNKVLDEEQSQGIADGYPGSFVCLSVADTGAGMEPEILKNIFEPFFSTKEIGRGTGLGLAVVYGIVKQHEGFIQVLSQPDQGTVFHIYLPAVQGAEAPRPLSRPEILPGQGECFLVVEDDEQLRDLVWQAARDFGYHALKASNAKEAGQLFAQEKERIAMVFSDVVLPDQSGLRLLEGLRAVKPDVKVLLTSGYADYRSQWPEIQAKGYSFLQKPYSIAELMITIRNMIGKKV
jgi:PAS domain S-box-containing protein